MTLPPLGIQPRQAGLLLRRFDALRDDLYLEASGGIEDRFGNCLLFAVAANALKLLSVFNASTGNCISCQTIGGCRSRAPDRGCRGLNPAHCRPLNRTAVNPDPGRCPERQRSLGHPSSHRRNRDLIAFRSNFLLVSKEHLLEEAQSCRRQVLSYVGRPEAPFLLNVANAFEQLAFRGVQRPPYARS